MAVPISLRRTVLHLTKHWKRLPYLLIFPTIWLVHKLAEDEIVGMTKELLKTHADFLLHLAAQIAFFILKYPFILLIVACIGIVVHAYLTSNRRITNLVCDGWGFTSVVRDGEVYRRRTMASSTMPTQFAWILNISNIFVPEKNVVSAGRVKAQMTLHIDKHGDRLISPGVWLDELCSGATFDISDTRDLLVLLGLDFKDTWVVMANRRSRPEDSAAFDYIVELWPGSRGTIDVHFISGESNDILQTVQIKWRWEYGYHPQIENVERTVISEARAAALASQASSC